MKTLIKITIFSALLLLLTACSSSSPDNTTPSPTPEPSPTATPPPTTPLPITSEPTPEPTPPPPQRTWQPTPYLARLKPYTNNLLTDGMNTFEFMPDGTIQVNMLYGGSFTLDTKPPEPTSFAEYYETEEFLQAARAAAIVMGWAEFFTWDTIWEWFQIIHIEDGNFYFHHNGTGGGGSGESFFHAYDARFFRVNAEGEVMDFGPIRAIHIIWHEGYFFFMQLEDRILMTPGTGRILRVDPSGENTKVIVDEIAFGPFQIADNRLFYTSLSGIIYAVDLDGSNKTAICTRIAPRYHRPRLNFYGNTIIHDSWMRLGYGIGAWFSINDHANPAIMCITGGCLVTFPPELTGYDPYTVITWSYESEYSTFGGAKFLIMRSKNDGSYWVYVRTCWHDFYSDLFEFAQEQHSPQ